MLSRVAGAFLLVHGLAAILMAWWAYSVTHEAFASVRSFTTAFQHERSQAEDALRGAVPLLGSRESGSAIARRLGAPAPSPGASAQASGAGGPLDELARRIDQAASSWDRLGEGPTRPGVLDRVELATTALVVW